MNIKQKLATAKTKIKRYAPEIIGFGSAVAVVALAAHAIRTSLNEEVQEFILIPTSNSKDEPGDEEGCMMIVDSGARKKIQDDESFDLRHVDRDLYELRLNTPEED